MPQLAERLLGAGLDPATPAIAVENATRLDERGIRAPLGRTVAAVAGAGLDGPTLVLIGQVVALGDTIQQAVDLAA